MLRRSDHFRIGDDLAAEIVILRVTERAMRPADKLINPLNREILTRKAARRILSRSLPYGQADPRINVKSLKGSICPATDCCIASRGFINLYVYHTHRIDKLFMGDSFNDYYYRYYV